MTPTQVIARVISRFDVLYFDNETALESMMGDTMGEYQDRAGSVKAVIMTEAELALPDDLLMVVASSDNYGRYVPVTVTDTQLIVASGSSFPVKVSYLVNFRDLDMEADLPKDSVGLIIRHFEAALRIRNVRLERNVSIAAGLQRELPSEETLQAQLETIEKDMEEARAIIPMMTVM